MLDVPEIGGCEDVVYADTDVWGAVKVVLTFGGLVAATAGGPVVTSIVPVISLEIVSVEGQDSKTGCCGLT